MVKKKNKPLNTPIPPPKQTDDYDAKRDWNDLNSFFYYYLDRREERKGKGGLGNVVDVGILAFDRSRVYDLDFSFPLTTLWEEGKSCMTGMA